MYNVALIGTGYWGSKLRRYIKGNDRFNLKHICNSKSDLNEVWQDSSTRATVIAVRNEQRYHIVEQALSYNKNVLCEKPLALTSTEADILRGTATTRNLSLVTDYIWTFSEGLDKARNIVNGGTLGKLLGISMTFKHLGRFRGGSCYWLLGSHGLSILDTFVPLADLQFLKHDIITHDGNIESGFIYFTGDVPGQIELSLNYPDKTTEVTLYCSTGTIMFTPLKYPSLAVEHYERLEWTLGSRLPRSRECYETDERNNLRHAVTYFADVLDGKEQDNLDRAVDITKILEKLQA